MHTTCNNVNKIAESLSYAGSGAKYEEKSAVRLFVGGDYPVAVRVAAPVIDV